MRFVRPRTSRIFSLGSSRAHTAERTTRAKGRALFDETDMFENQSTVNHIQRM